MLVTAFNSFPSASYEEILRMQDFFKFFAYRTGDNRSLPLLAEAGDMGIGRFHDVPGEDGAIETM